MKFQKLKSLVSSRALGICLYSSTLVAPTAFAEPERKAASPDEILAGTWYYPRDRGGSSDGRWLPFATNKGRAMIDLSTNQMSDASELPAKTAWCPTNSSAAVVAWREGKAALTLWSPESGAKRELLVFPRRLQTGDPVWSEDGKTIFMCALLDLPREKSRPEQDNPPTRSLNANLEVTAPYEDTAEYRRFSKRYSDAYAEGTRTLVLAIDAASGEVRLVCTGNDTNHIGPSPDGKTLALIQFKYGVKGKETAWTGQVLADVYLAQVEQAKLLSASDLENYEDRTAGWVDNSGARIAPALSNLELNDQGLWDPNFYKGNGENRLLTWASNSRRFAFATVGRKSSGDVFVYDVGQKVLTNISEHTVLSPQTKNLGYGLNYTFQWDSQKFGHLCPPLWLPDDNGLVAVGRGDVWYLPVDPAMSARNLTKDIASESRLILSTNTWNRASVDAAGNLIVVCKDSDPAGRTDSVWKVNIKDGKSVKVADLAAWVTVLRASDRAGSRIIYGAHTNTATDNFYELDLAGEAVPKKLTHFQEQLEDRAYPECKVLSWKTSWGAKAYGLLYLPKTASPDHKVPMILDGYPGQWESLVDARARGGPRSLDQPLLSFLKEGIAIFRPDLPMSNEGVYEHPMKQVVDGVNAATDAALASGCIDDTKLGIMGQSYGGFMVQAVITQTDRFKVAVSIDGLSDWYADYLDQSDQVANYHEVAQGRFGQPLWDDPSRYVDNSPFSYWGQVHTPLLLIHGDADHTVPLARSIQSFHGLERLGRTAIFAHGLRDGHFPGTEQTFRIHAWFREYLFGEKPTAHIAAMPSFFFDGDLVDPNAVAKAKAKAATETEPSKY